MKKNSVTTDSVTARLAAIVAAEEKRTAPLQQLGPWATMLAAMKEQTAK